MLATRLLVVTSTIVMIAVAAAQEVAKPPPAAANPSLIAEIDAAMLAHDYATALVKIDAGLPNSGVEREALHYRRGLALLYQGKHADALAQFAEQVVQFPASLWMQKAKFRQADCHVAMKQFDAAERIYAELTAELVGDARRSRIGQLYLDFAREYDTPKDALTKPDFGRARAFYQRAIEFEPGEAVRDEAMFKRAACSLRIGERQPAIDQFREYLTVFDREYRAAILSRSATATLTPAPTEAGKFCIEARLQLADALLANTARVDARREYQDLIALLSTLDAELAKHCTTWCKAQLGIAGTYQLPTPNDNASLTLGGAALEKLIERCPESVEAVIAERTIAESYASRGRADEAIAAFRRLIDRTRIQPATDEARGLADTAAQDAVFSIADQLYKQNKYADAIGMWNQYIAKYPSGPKWSASQQWIVNAEYQIGADAFADQKFDEARAAWTAFLSKYPLDGRAAATLNQLANIEFLAQSKREESKDKADWTETIALYRKVVNKYPGTEEAGSAQFRIALILEEKVKNLDAAFEEYGKINWSASMAPAQRRLAEMKATRLNVLVPRVFRTNEPVKVRVDTRNVDALTVKLYRIDMLDYFHKQHTSGGVDRLDLALIDPDQTIELPVGEYGKYRPVSQEIELPIDGAATVAVTVTNENSKLASAPGIDHAKLEATALVVRSDIDIIVKTSRRQVLVYAQNMLDQTPTPGVELLVSDYSRSMLTGKTGDDGVWIGKADDLATVTAINVLARRDGHVAASGTLLNELSLSTGLTPRGFIITDRPAYRPGDAVNIRAILREAKEGQFAVASQPADENLRWKLDVLDPEGRVLSTTSPEISPFGTMSAQFTIAADGRLGVHKLIARRPDGPTFTGEFVVAQFDLAKAYLAIDLDHRVVLRGEKLSGAITAKYHYGEAVAGKTVEYAFALPSGDVIRHVGVTDKEGKIKFDFDTTIVPEEAAITIVAQQAELALQTQTAATIAVRAMRAELTTPRALYLTGQAVEATVKATDLKGEPLATDISLTALKRVVSRGVWTESRIESQNAKTDAKSGNARVTFKFDKDGEYVLRAEGKDRFGHTVSVDRFVVISGDEDSVKLRLLAQRETYKVGETITLDLHSRVAAGERAAGVAGRPGYRALLTYEAEEVIGHKTVWVQPGSNALEVPVAHEHFPNFNVAVALMAGDKFHEASAVFNVERQLNITLKPSSETLRPRDELAVDVIVTDQTGRPVQAEIGLSMIDQSLLDQYPDGSPAIVEFFNAGARRVAGLRGSSSCTYRHAAQTRGMVTDVLNELARLDDAVRDKLAEVGYVTNQAEAQDEAFPAMQLAEAGAQLNSIAGGARGGGARAGRGSTRGAPPPTLLRRLVPGDTVQSEPSATTQPHGGPFHYTVDEARDFEHSGPANADALRGKSEFLHLGAQVQRFIDALPRDRAFDSKLPSRFDELRNDIVRDAPPNTHFPEVAYWNPHIVTDETGKATVKIVLPDSTTRWKLIARGASKETLVGDATASVVTRQDFFAELLLPNALVEGDAARPLVRVHSLAAYSGDVEVLLQVATKRRSDGATEGKADEARTQRKTATFTGAGVVDVEFEAIKAAGTDDLIITATATTAAEVPDAKRKLTAVASRQIGVRPWGMRLEENVAGIGRDTDFVEIELPASPPGGNYHDRRLTIAIGPSMPRWLLDEALESGPRWTGIDQSLRSNNAVPPRTHADTAATLVGALYAADYARATGATTADGNAASDVRLLSNRVAALAAQLVASQRDDGGWAWSGRGTASDPWTSSYVAWSLGKARRDKLSIANATTSKLSAYLQRCFADARPEQTELKAVALFGLSWLGEVDFGHANRLYRNRTQLSNSALAHLALVFCNLDRTPIAIELLAELDKRATQWKRGNQSGNRIAADGCSAWMVSDLEISALTLLGHLRTNDRSTSIPPLVSYLTGTARAEGWNPHKARGPVLAALTTWFGGSRTEQSAYTLTVSVNGKERTKLTPDAKGCVRIDLAASDLVDGKQRVDFAFAGRGEYAYAVTYSAFATAFPDNIRNRGEAFWINERWYAPPPLEYKGRPVPTGFSATREHKWFGNRVTKIAQGAVVQAQVNYGRHHERSNSPAGDADYVIVQESIPAGFRLLTETIQSNQLAWDYSDNVLTLYYGSQHDVGWLRYQMVAQTPGDFRVPPTVIRSLYAPDRYNLHKSDKISVLPRGEKSDDPYRMTPDELNALAQMNFNDGNFEAVNTLLRELLDARDWSVHDNVYREAVRMLLTAALKRDAADDVVNYFEILKEKYPDLLVPFDQITRIAAAYGRTNQHERAYLIYRAIADTAFSEDIAVAGVLQGEGKFLAGVDFLESLWREYPDTPQVESTYFAAIQSLYAQAETASTLVPRGGPTAARVTRGDVTREAIAHLERFLGIYPESPIADEAAYSLANAYLDLDKFDVVLARTDQFVKRFEKSKWLDRFRYIQALAHFNLGNFDKARELAEIVTKATFRDEQGIERPSPNRALALYIIGQIYHAQGDKARALEFYKQVKEQFSDAGEAIAYFEQKLVRLPELTVFHPDRGGFREAQEWSRHLKRANLDSNSAANDAKPSDGVALVAQGAPAGAADIAPLHARPYVELTHRNLKHAVLQVYRVDLMKLMLIQKNPTAITSVNLAGVKPLIERTVELGSGLDYVDRSTRVQLDGIVRAAAAGDKADTGEADGSGAYLVICRGEDLLASGLVLVTPLALDVVSEPGAGRVRVNVASAIDRDGMKGVHVKVMGMGMQTFVSGETDLRGVAVADGVTRYPTAIARDERGHVALFRSEEIMLAAAMPRQELQQQSVGEKADYRKNLQLDNRQMQMLNNDALERMYRTKQRRGVEVQKAN